MALDEPHLIACAGLVPAVALADRIGLGDLADEWLTVPGARGTAGAKVMSLVAGMLAGADGIADLDLLRHGGMDKVFTDMRAPSTLGTFLRGFTFGHVRQLDAVVARALIGLAGEVPALLAGVDATVMLDIDDTGQGGVRFREAGRRARIHPGQGIERAAGHDQHRQGPRR